VKFVPLEAHHAASSLETPLPHKDPFDELLLVQAQEEGLRLMTSDRQLAGHPLAISLCTGSIRTAESNSRSIPR
jgi:PIN domain nuclease of toxin-antitoxin system